MLSNGRFGRRRLLHYWDKLSASYWFVPAVMVAGALALALTTLWIDESLLNSSEHSKWVYGGGVEGARVLLSTVAGSVITVAGVVFSITIAALTQASSQFGPRILRNFMRDRGNQIVLGTFVATFVYCLLVLRSTGTAGEGVVPNLSVTCGVLLSLASIGVLVFFIHHVSLSLQAPHVVANVWEDIDGAIRRMFPEHLGHGGRPQDSDAQTAFPESFDREAFAVRSRESGYVQAVDGPSLMALAVEHDLRLRLLYRPGDFVIGGDALALLWPPRDDADEVIGEFRAAWLFGRSRTPEQDVEFGIDQMVEIAVRALSPGINDPFTAMTCVDWLGEALVRIAANELHSAFRYDDEGLLRVIADVSTYEGVVGTAFNPIRQYGRTSASVTIRLLETIAAVGRQVRTEAQRKPLRQQAQIIRNHAHEALPEEKDRADVQSRFESAMKILMPVREP
jgi:uncharacterized membrane protein